MKGSLFESLIKSKKRQPLQACIANKLHRVQYELKNYRIIPAVQCKVLRTKLLYCCETRDVVTSLKGVVNHLVI